MVRMVRSLADRTFQLWYREPVPPALEDYGVTEDEWEQFADEAALRIRLKRRLRKKGTIEKRKYG